MKPTQHEFYLERAQEARRGADAATLENVRDRWLRSAATWTEMAARTARVEAMHAALLADKAAARTAQDAPLEN